MAPQKKTVSLTYEPIHEDDRTVTEWNGIRFKAHVPVELDRENPAHHIMQLIVTSKDGGQHTHAVEKRVFMGDAAKNNPSWSVDGVRPPRKVNTRVVPPPGAEWTDAHEGQIFYAEKLDRDMAL